MSTILISLLFLLLLPIGLLCLPLRFEGDSAQGWITLSFNGVIGLRFWRKSEQNGVSVFCYKWERALTFQVHKEPGKWLSGNTVPLRSWYRKPDVAALLKQVKVNYCVVEIDTAFPFINQVLSWWQPVLQRLMGVELSVNQEGRNLVRFSLEARPLALLWVWGFHARWVRR